MSNEFSGSASKVVQVGQALGPLTLNFGQLPPAPEPDRPHEVPVWTQRVFVNRLEPMRLLDEVVTASDEPPRIVACCGRRGVGKTALVRRWVGGLDDRFSGGHLYVDFGQLRRHGPVAPSDALISCLRSLGVDRNAIPSTYPELRRLYATKTSAKPILVVLDDVQEVEQVTALVPNCRGGLVLACGDPELVMMLGDAVLIELEPLDRQSALELLANHCGVDRVAAEPEAMAQLVDFCDRLPIALHVVGARLRNRFISAADLVAELARERDRLTALSIHGDDVVRNALMAGVRDLPPPAAELFPRLGLLPLTHFSAEVAARLGGQPMARIRVALEQLLAFRMLEQTDRDRYQLPGLIRLLAQELAEAGAEPRTVPGSEAAIYRAAQYYLDAAIAADHASMGARLRITPAGQGSDTANGFDLGWLDANRANLMAVLHAAAVHGWTSLVWQLAETLTALFFNLRYLDDWRVSGELGIDAAKADARPDAAARLMCTTSRALTELGRHDDARRLLDEALGQIEGMTGDQANPLLLASVWEFRGRHLEGADPQAAAGAFRASVRANLDAGDSRGEALARLFLGNLLGRQGHHEEEAAAELRRAHAALLALPHPDARNAARALHGLAIVLTRTGRAGEASASLEQAVAVLAAGGWTHYEVAALQDLAGVRLDGGDQDGARLALQRAIDLEHSRGGSKLDELCRRLNALESQQ